MNLFKFTKQISGNETKVSFEDFNYIMKKNQNPLFNEYVGLNAYMLGVTGFLDTQLEDKECKKDEVEVPDSNSEHEGTVTQTPESDVVEDITPSDPNIKELFEEN